MKRVISILMLVLLLTPFKVHAEEKYSKEQVKEIASVVFIEANTQSERGKRLVIDVILNRVDNKEFPNTLEGVLTQKSQFSKVRKEPSEDLIRLVEQELEKRTNKDVLFFKTDDYHSFAEPIIKEGDHYFSGLEE